MSSGVQGHRRPLLVVIPASSGPVTAPPSPPYMRPIMGRPQLSYVLDAALALDPVGVIVFAHGADDTTCRDMRALMPPRGSVVAGAGNPADFIGRMFTHIREHPGDILFVPATAAPLDGTFLSDFVDDYRRHSGVPYRVETTGPDGERRTRLLIADASSIREIDGASGDREGSFADLVFGLLDKQTHAKGARVFISGGPQRPGDIAVARDFAAALRAARTAVVDRLMDAGVTIIDPERTYADWGVTVGPGTTLYPDTYLEGATSLGKGCVVEPNVKITDSILGDEVIVKMCSVITESVVEAGGRIGPFAHLRPKTHLGRDVKIGNFVEIKKTTVGEGSKASHLSYLGDARIGKGVNVGAGTITCNYDGVDKHTTTIGDGAFIGSDTQFIAPVTLGEYCLIGAGSTITKDVPPNALAVGRSKQVTIPGRGVKSRKKHGK